MFASLAKQAGIGVKTIWTAGLCSGRLGLEGMSQLVETRVHTKGWSLVERSLLSYDCAFNGRAWCQRAGYCGSIESGQGTVVRCGMDQVQECSTADMAPVSSPAERPGRRRWAGAMENGMRDDGGMRSCLGRRAVVDKMHASGLGNIHDRSLGSGRGGCDGRRFVSFFQGFQEDGGTGKYYHERKLLGYSQQQMYSVIANVGEYSEFVPWCQRSVVVKDEGRYMEAELEVGFQIFVERYVSQIQLNPPYEVKTHTGDSTLFDHLDSCWKLSPGPSPHSVWVDFEVDFEFKSALYRQVASMFFEEVVKKMMAAFEQRAGQLYGAAALRRRHS